MENKFSDNKPNEICSFVFISLSFIVGCEKDFLLHLHLVEMFLPISFVSVVDENRNTFSVGENSFRVFASRFMLRFDSQENMMDVCLKSFQLNGRKIVYTLKFLTRN